MHMAIGKKKEKEKEKEYTFIGWKGEENVAVLQQYGLDELFSFYSSQRVRPAVPHQARRLHD